MGEGWLLPPDIGLLRELSVQRPFTSDQRFASAPRGCQNPSMLIQLSWSDDHGPFGSFGAKEVVAVVVGVVVGVVLRTGVVPRSRSCAPCPAGVPIFSVRPISKASSRLA